MRFRHYVVITPIWVWSWIKNKEIEIDDTFEGDSTYPESTSHEFGLNVNNSIRLGFWF